jgi:parallel beta-helix repeat protein
VTIDGQDTCDPVRISGSRARFQGFRVVNGGARNIDVTGSDNVVATNRVGPDARDTTGIVLSDGAQRNVIVANVVINMRVVADESDGIGIRIDSSAGPNNLLLHNVVARNEDTGITINASKTTLIGNVVTDNGLGDGGDGIDIDSPGVRGTALKGNVALQNGGNGNPADHDIEMHPQSQRPVLKGNTYERSGVQ